MAMQFNNLCDLILESPDLITIEGGHELAWWDKSTYPVSFLVIDEMVIYTANIKLTHNFLWQLVNTKASDSKGDIVKELAMADIKVINPSSLLKNPTELIRIYKRFIARFHSIDKAPQNVIAGRFWKVGNGYVSFWENYKQVLNHLDPVERLIEQLGFEPSEVMWEITVGTNKSIVSYDKYVEYRDTTQSTKKDEERRMQEYALHTKAGMKKLVGVQNRPRVTRDVEARFLPPEK